MIARRSIARNSTAGKGIVAGEWISGWRARDAEEAEYA